VDLRLCAAGSATPCDESPGNDPVFTGGDDLLDLQSEALPRLDESAFEPFSDFLAASVDPHRLSPKHRVLPLDVRINRGEERIRILPGPRISASLDDLYVLLRHRPRSISRSACSSVGRCRHADRLLRAPPTPLASGAIVTHDPSKVVGGVAAEIKLLGPETLALVDIGQVVVLGQRQRFAKRRQPQLQRCAEGVGALPSVGLICHPGATTDSDGGWEFLSQQNGILDAIKLRAKVLRNRLANGNVCQADRSKAVAGPSG
jgi:hypothetical protein